MPILKTGHIRKAMFVNDVIRIVAIFYISEGNYSTSLTGNILNERGPA